MKAACRGLALLLSVATVLGAAPRPASLAARLDAVLRRPALAHGIWAVQVRSAENGRVLYSRQAGLLLHPASTLKLVTTAAALDAFGAEARFATTLQAAAPLEADGTLRGDLYLVGGGDSMLDAEEEVGEAAVARLEALAAGLAAAGVKRVEGRLLGHDGLFPGERRGRDWTWEDLVWSYGAEVSALSFHDNVVTLRVRPGEREGDPLMVTREPETAYLRVVSTAYTAPAASAATELVLRRGTQPNEILLSGRYPWRGPERVLRVSVEDPARYAATVLAETLARQGIAVGGGVAGTAEPLPQGARVLARVQGPALREVVRQTNKPSQNLRAEVLLRLVGRGEGSAEAGLAAVRDFLRRSGVDDRPWELRDGSGLSRADLVTAEGMVDLLLAMRLHPQAAAFLDSLPLAGVDGTLKGRLKGTAAEGRVRAKTGTLRQGNGLVGYVQSRTRGLLAFAILASHNPADLAVVSAIDDLVVALAES